MQHEPSLQDRDHLPATLMGILNTTEDSFSDGGQFLHTETAIGHAIDMMDRGAHAIDVGAVSSNPESAPVSTEVEIQRLEPVIAALQARSIPVSVDTFSPEVQKYCLGQGVDYINDIQGFPFPELYPRLADSDAMLIVMHSIHRIGRARIQETEPEEVLASVHEFFDERVAALEGAGVAANRIILDPGMGFFLGSHPESSLHVLRQLDRLIERYNKPFLISVSRKSFLGKITDRPVTEREPSTLAAELYAVHRGAQYIRTHRPDSLRDALLIQSALGGQARKRAP